MMVRGISHVGTAGRGPADRDVFPFVDSPPHALLNELASNYRDFTEDEQCERALRGETMMVGRPPLAGISGRGPAVPNCNRDIPPALDRGLCGLLDDLNHGLRNVRLERALGGNTTKVVRPPLAGTPGRGPARRSCN